MDDTNTDVNTAQGESAPESSTETKPSTEPTGETSQVTVEQKKEPMVPYSRFKAVNEKLNEFKARDSARTLQNGGMENPKTAESDTQAGETSTVDVSTLSKQLRQQGFLTREDQEVSNRVAEAKSLVSELDGKNGLPPFDIDEVTSFMKERKVFGSYRDAYNLLHHEAIVAHEIERARKVGSHVTKPKEGDSAFADAPTGDGSTSAQSIGKMSVEEWAKAGGSKGLKDKILSGQLKG